MTAGGVNNLILVCHTKQSLVISYVDLSDGIKESMTVSDDLNAKIYFYLRKQQN